MTQITRWLLVPLVMLFCSCERNRIASFVEPMISSPLSRDLGIAGVWNYPLLGDQLGHSANHDPPPVAIVVTGPGSDGIYKIEAAEWKDTAITMRAANLNREPGYVVMEVAFDTPATHDSIRWLAVAKIETDTVYLWWVQSTNLANSLHDEDVSAVIERDSFQTRVLVKPDGLLKTIRLHAKDLVGQPLTLRRMKQQNSGNK